MLHPYVAQKRLHTPSGYANELPTTPLDSRSFLPPRNGRYPLKLLVTP